MLIKQGSHDFHLDTLQPLELLDVGRDVNVRGGFELRFSAEFEMFMCWPPPFQWYWLHIDTLICLGTLTCHLPLSSQLCGTSICNFLRSYNSNRRFLCRWLHFAVSTYHFPWYFNGISMVFAAFWKTIPQIKWVSNILEASPQTSKYLSHRSGKLSKKGAVFRGVCLSGVVALGIGFNVIVVCCWCCCWCLLLLMPFFVLVVVVTVVTVSFCLLLFFVLVVVVTLVTISLLVSFMLLFSMAGGIHLSLVRHRKTQKPKHEANKPHHSGLSTNDGIYKPSNSSYYSQEKVT